MLTQHKGIGGGHFALAGFDGFVSELFHAPAGYADEVIVMAPFIEFEYRVIGFEAVA